MLFSLYPQIKKVLTKISHPSTAWTEQVQKTNLKWTEISLYLFFYLRINFLSFKTHYFFQLLIFYMVWRNKLLKHQIIFIYECNTLQIQRLPNMMIYPLTSKRNFQPFLNKFNQHLRKNLPPLKKFIILSQTHHFLKTKNFPLKEKLKKFNQ